MRASMARPERLALGKRSGQGPVIIRTSVEVVTASTEPSIRPGLREFPNAADASSRFESPPALGDGALTMSGQGRRLDHWRSSLDVVEALRARMAQVLDPQDDAVARQLMAHVAHA